MSKCRNYIELHQFYFAMITRRRKWTPWARIVKRTRATIKKIRRDFFDRENSLIHWFYPLHLLPFPLLIAPPKNSQRPYHPFNFWLSTKEIEIVIVKETVQWFLWDEVVVYKFMCHAVSESFISPRRSIGLELLPYSHRSSSSLMLRREKGIIMRTMLTT